MEAIYYAAVFFLRQARTSRRLPAALFLSTFQPMVWMVLFGHLFQSVATIRGFAADSYVQFLAPGIAIMTALFGSTYSGLGVIGDIHSGLFDKILATPAPRGAILVGPLLQTALQTMIQSTVILLTAIAMGARPEGGIPGILMLLLSVALIGSIFGAISHSIALLTRRQQTLIAVVNLVSMPLTFLSSMFISHNLMPQWMLRASAFNPIDWAVTAGRAAFEGQPMVEFLEPIGLLAILALLTWTLTAKSFAFYQRSL